jgi:hypothetical protein
MDRLQTAESRFFQTVTRLEAALRENATVKARIREAVAEAEALENRAGHAMNALRDLVRQTSEPKNG